MIFANMLIDSPRISEKSLNAHLLRLVARAAGILGVVSIVIGILLMMNMFAAAIVLPWVIAIFLIIGGIFAIISSFTMR